MEKQALKRYRSHKIVDVGEDAPTCDHCDYEMKLQQVMDRHKKKIYVCPCSGTEVVFVPEEELYFSHDNLFGRLQ